MEQSQKFIEAQKRVKEIKGFYSHLTAYIIVNLALLLLRMPIVIFFTDMGGETADPGFLDWINWNVVLTPLLWGIALFIHFIVVFGKKSGFVRKWEDRKIREFMKEEEEKAGNLYQ